MKLPAGATGFDPPSDAHTNLGHFTAVCRQAARDIAATVTDVTPAGVTPNFHTIDIRHAEQHVSVLGHCVLPFIAFARPRADDDIRITFVDHHDLAAAIVNLTEAQVLTAEQLRTPLAHIDLTSLGRHEHDQIGYWKPSTLGDLLFNFWD